MSLENSRRRRRGSSACHWREMFADTLVGEAEELRELAGGGFVVAAAAIVCLSAIPMPPRNVSVRARATGR
jgi:hypothetical protein